MECRVCKNELISLLTYKNMPKSAQNFPDESSVKYDSGVDLEICQCTGCELVQLSNEPVSYYREVIRATAFSQEMKEFRLKQFDEFVKKYSLEGKKVLEAGCGKGEYLSLMNEFNIDGYGIEYAEDSVKYCVVLVMSSNGRGARGYYTTIVKKGRISRQQRLFKETYYSVKYALRFNPLLESIGYKVNEIHTDLNPDSQYPSSDMIQSCIGYIRGMGFVGKTKPESWASYGVADIKTK